MHGGNQKFSVSFQTAYILNKMMGIINITLVSDMSYSVIELALGVVRNGQNFH